MEYHEKILFLFNRMAEGHRFDKFTINFLMTHAKRAARWGDSLRLSEKQMAFIDKEMESHARLYQPAEKVEKQVGIVTL